MDMKQGIGKLKAQQGSSLHFFFCEKGADDKPVVLLDTKAVSKDAEKEVLAKAKNKAQARGTMHIDEAGDLCITPRGSCPGGLKNGVEKAAKNAGVAGYFKNVKLLTAGNEGDEAAATLAGYSDPDAAAQPRPGNGYGTVIPAGEVEQEITDNSLGYSTPAEPDANSLGYSTPDRGDSNGVNYSTPDNQGGNAAPAKNAAPGANAYITPNLETGYPKRTKDGANGKVYPDALRKGSAMAKLLDLKEKTQRELAALADQQDADPTKIAALNKRLDQIDAQMEAEIKKQAASGVSPKALESEYEGEDQKVGWKAWPGGKGPAPGETDEQVAARTGLSPAEVRKRRRVAETETTVRRNFDATEKANNTLKVGDDGRVRDNYGNLASERTEFVADPETGDLIGFPNQLGTSDKLVQNADGRTVQQETRTHHSTPLAGGDVAMAGSVTVADGEVTRVSNISGHYKPKVAEMLQFLEGLLRKGALLDREWADANGKPLEGNAKDVYEAAIKVQKKLKKKAERGEEVADDVAVIQKAMAMLEKMGCGPTNKINPNAKVEFLEVKDGMTGRDIKLATDQVAQNPSTVENFLQGGDNKKAQAAKANGLAEMKQNPRFQKAEANAEKHAAKPAAKPTAEAAARSMAKNLSAMEAMLANVNAEEQEPAESSGDKKRITPSEKKEMELSIANLKRKMAEATEPTDEDLKAMIRSILEIRNRLTGAAPQWQPANEALDEEPLEEGENVDVAVPYAEKKGLVASDDDDSESEDDEQPWEGAVDQAVPYAEMKVAAEREEQPVA